VPNFYWFLRNYFVNRLIIVYFYFSASITNPFISNSYFLGNIISIVADFSGD